MNIEIIRNTLYKVKHILVINKVNVLTTQQQEMELSQFREEIWKVVAEMIFRRLQILFQQVPVNV